MTETTQIERRETQPATTNTLDNETIALLPADFAQDLRARWDRIQAGFVDEPRTAVQQADELVASSIQRLTDSFAQARRSLERQWGHGEEVNTEELRVALRK